MTETKQKGATTTRKEQKTHTITLAGVCFGAGSAFLSVTMVTYIGPNPTSTLTFAILGLWVLAISYAAGREKTTKTEPKE